jgi:Icc protein
MTLRILQLTDLHLGPRLGDRRWLALARLLAELPGRVGVFDRIVLTGDLSTHGQPAVYRALRTQLLPWLDQLRLVPGNHDNSPVLREMFADRMLAGSPGATCVDDMQGLRLVGLDTSQPWRVSGRLGQAQLDWLPGVLDPGLPSLLFMHHPPLDVGTWWLDKDSLRDRDALASVIQDRGVLGAFCGHVHQAFRGSLGAVPVWTTPSTAYQFKPGSLIPRTRSAPPEFRLIEVAEGRLETTLISAV